MHWPKVSLARLRFSALVPAGSWPSFTLACSSDAFLRAVAGSMAEQRPKFMRRCFLPTRYWKIYRALSLLSRTRTPKPGRSSSHLMISLPFGARRIATFVLVSFTVTPLGFGSVLEALEAG